MTTHLDLLKVIYFLGFRGADPLRIVKGTQRYLASAGCQGMYNGAEGNVVYSRRIVPLVSSTLYLSSQVLRQKSAEASDLFPFPNSGGHLLWFVGHRLS